MKIIISMVVLIVSNMTLAEDLLKGYDTRKPSHSMTCWNKNAGIYEKFEVIGKQVIMDGETRVDYDQRQGNIFAIKLDFLGGMLTYIFDYDQKKLTVQNRKDPSDLIVMDCR